MTDEEMWRMGVYVMRAVGVTVDRAIHGPKAKTEYFDKPIMRDEELSSMKEPERELTEEEKKMEQEKVLMRLKLMMGNFETSKS